jgi:hypothetical protein
MTLIATSRVSARDQTRLKVEYSIASSGDLPGRAGAPAQPSVARGEVLEPPNPFAICTAVGQTSRGRVTIKQTEWSAQAVGVPGYPGQMFPRVLGLAEAGGNQVNPQIRHEQSDLFDFGPGNNRIVVAHVVNDAARSWGRRGVAAAMARRYPHAALAFRSWAITSGELRLGNIHVVEERDGDRSVLVVSMVAQHGFGPGAVTRLRYDALKEALSSVANLAARTDASVHVPRIGAGQAGGRWDLIENDLAATLSDRGIDVVVHTLPATAGFQGSQA